MILDLLPEGHSLLREVVPTFVHDDEVATTVERDLLDTMAHHRALGLAANQVGLNVRAFAILRRGESIVCFNPEIDLLGEAKLHDEGCLSFPDLLLRIKRPCAVFIRWSDAAGVQQRDTLMDYDAYAALHELDHLNGVTFDTLVSPLVLSMARKRRKKSKRVNTI